MSCFAYCSLRMVIRHLPSQMGYILVSLISSMTAAISGFVRVSCALGVGGLLLSELDDRVSGSKGLIGDIGSDCACMNSCW